jgi:suppressor for copper-sensitivity B
MKRLRAVLGGLLAITAVWLGLLTAIALEDRVFEEPARGAIAWKPWSRDALAAARAEGKVVFVDVTAAWCVTCKVNRTLVLERADVAALLNAPGTVALQADWTRPDPRIADYLAGFGRYGIPFNAVYGPGRPGGEALPELLTPETVRAALARAQKP